MTKIQRIKRITLIALGFGMATYLIMSGMTILKKDMKASQDVNSTSEVHTHAVK